MCVCACACVSREASQRLRSINNDVRGGGGGGGGGCGEIGHIDSCDAVRLSGARVVLVTQNDPELGVARACAAIVRRN